MSEENNRSYFLFGNEVGAVGNTLGIHTGEAIAAKKAQPLNADILGHKYTADDIDDINENLAKLQPKYYEVSALSTSNTITVDSTGTYFIHLQGQKAHNEQATYRIYVNGNMIAGGITHPNEQVTSISAIKTLNKNDVISFGATTALIDSSTEYYSKLFAFRI